MVSEFPTHDFTGGLLWAGHDASRGQAVVIAMVVVVNLLGVASVVNVVEDGFGQSWAFWGFVLSLATILLALLALTVAIVVTGGGQYRLLAPVPAGTVVGIVGFVEVGGVVMVTTWSMAAALALLPPTRGGGLAGARM